MSLIIEKHTRMSKRAKSANIIPTHDSSESYATFSLIFNFYFIFQEPRLLQMRIWLFLDSRIRITDYSMR